jgi:pimeloyl-ACP methyl ester carboxylesterase
MPSVTGNGIQIEYETFGAPGARPLILIMGLGAQMIHWDDEFCRLLVERGHFVIRFDNRDIGLSSKLDHLGPADSTVAMARRLQGEPVEAPYKLSDMAADCAGLLDALGIDAAHVVGASLGGMIAQTLAIEHPSRVLSLTSIMSSTGNSELPQATPEALAALLSPLPGSREEAMDRSVRVFRTIGSPGFPFDEARVRDRAARAYDRAFHPAGVARQFVAALASGSRTELLHAVMCPALVIHGKEDPLVPVEAGIDTARSIPGADLLVLAGMGHDLPKPLWPRIVDEIAGVTSRARAS